MNPYIPEFEKKILARLAQLGIPKLMSVSKLNKKSGDTINLECTLSNWWIGKILDDKYKFQVSKKAKKCTAVP